jgi:acetyltransferase-like isoleucine patch superfamily enzyme
MMNTWTIFGAGYLLYDIVDAINSSGDRVKQIVVNRPTNISLEEFDVVPIQNYKEDSSLKIFGFIDPDKETFLSALGDIGFHNLVHPTAHIGMKTNMADGNFLNAHSTIASCVHMNRFNVFNRNCSIGHHCEIGSCNHFAPGVTICSKCVIGNKVFIGAGTTITPGIHIGNNVFIRAGSLITKDIL